MKKQIFITLSSLTLIIFGIYSYYRVIYLPFPFIEIKYVNETLFYSKPLNYQNDKPLDNLIFEIKNEVRATRDIIYSGEGDVIRTKKNIFQKDKKFMNICSENSKVFYQKLKSKNIPARVVWMNGHTVTEVYHPETNWFIVDSYGDIMVKNCKGDYLSIIEIKKEKCLDIIDISPDTGPGVNYKSDNYLDSDSNVFKSNELYVVIEDEYLFQFHINSKNIIKIIKFILRKNEIGKGKQLIEDGYNKVGNFGLFTFY